MKKISTIHGCALSAWAVAGLTGNNLSEIILRNTNNDYSIIFYVSVISYLFALGICCFIVKDKKEETV